MKLTALHFTSCFAALALHAADNVPPDGFTLQPGDQIQIEISGIGRLENAVVEV